MRRISEKKRPEARGTAFSILNTLDKGRRTLDNIIEEVIDEESPLSRRDRSLVYALVYGVLRWRGQLDWIISYFSKTRLNKIAPDVLNILRIGLFQIICLDRIPVSAAVNTSVEMTKSCAAPWTVRFVNGLLRNAARGYETVPFPDADKDQVAALAAEKSFPRWLVKRWLNHLGFEETGRLCDAVNTIPPLTVRANTLMTTREQLMESLGPDVGKMELTPYAPDGIRFSNPKISVPEMKAFKNGGFQVQDEAAQLVTYLLNPQPGETILDACAGLGGKTGHIAQQMKNQGHILALDKDGEKLSRLRAEMDRLGVSIVETYVCDLNEKLTELPSNVPEFDRILLDAPCSGLGVLRRNPDIKWFMSEKELPRYKERQIKFLDTLAHLVKPSGIMVYAVCSTEPEENELVVTDFLHQHPEYEIINLKYRISNKSQMINSKSQINPKSQIPNSKFMKTFPHIDNMDGFFAVCFRRVK